MHAIPGILLLNIRGPGVLQACLSAIGSDREDAGPTHDPIRDARDAVAQLVGAASTDPLQSDVNCTLCADLLSAWARFSNDPDTDVVFRLTEGAPAGILDHPLQMGIFPDAVKHADFMDPADAEFGDPALRMSFAEDDYALSEMDRLCAARFIKKFATLDLCTEFRGCTPVVSKFGLVIKEKPSGIERRLILDAKESGVTRCARRNQRIILPEVLDVVFDALTSGCEGQAVEALVLYVSDAFWTLPLRTRERRYFVGKLRGHFNCNLRLAQGSRGALLAWGRFIALMERLAQAVVGTRAARLQIFVDDPILVSLERLLNDRT